MTYYVLRFKTTGIPRVYTNMENISKKSTGPLETTDQRVTGGTLPTLTKRGRIVINRKKDQVVNDLIANADSSTYKMKHTKPKKSEKLSSHISIEQSIDPDRLVERTLHSYLCSCGNRPTECPDPVTLLAPEVIASRLTYELWLWRHI